MASVQRNGVLLLGQEQQVVVQFVELRVHQPASERNDWDSVSELVNEIVSEVVH